MTDGEDSSGTLPWSGMYIRVPKGEWYLPSKDSCWPLFADMPPTPVHGEDYPEGDPRCKEWLPPDYQPGEAAASSP